MLIRPLPISKAQKQFRESRAWMRGFVGGRGAGKTRIGSTDISQRALPGDPWMAISPDNNMIRETTLPTFLEVVEFTGQYVDHVLSPTPRVWFRSQWGNRGSKPAEIVFKGAEKPDKLRGPNKAGIWFDEASIISQAAFEIGIAVCRYRGRMGPVLATFTPRGFQHWTFKSFYSSVDEAKIGTDGCSADDIHWLQGRPFRPQQDTCLVHCPTRENPFLAKEYVGRVGQNYSSTLSLQELEGEFIEIAGLVFQRDWLSQTVISAPANATRVRYWDKAATADAGCFTVGLLMAKDSRGLYYVEDVIRGQWSQHNRNQIMLQTAQQDARKYGAGSVLTYIEQEGGGDGKSIADQLITMLSAFPVYRDVVGGGQWKTKGNTRLPGDAKVRRALPFAAQAEAGNVRLCEGNWNRDYIDELTMFPEFAFADQVDASSGAYNVLQRIAPTYGEVSQRSTEPMPSSRFGQTAHLSNGNSISQWSELPWNQQNIEPIDDRMGR